MSTKPNPIPEGAEVSYTDENGDEWAAVVVQQLPRNRYDVRLTETPGRQKVIAHRTQLETWT